MNALALPILIPFAFMILLIISRSDKAARWIAVAGSFLMVIVSLVLLSLLYRDGILVLQVGGWPAPFGISLVLDHLSALMLCVASVIVLTVALFSVKFMQEDCASNRFYVFFFSLVMGMNGAFITGDIFNLFVWFELMLLSSFVLITYGCSKDQLRGGIKYLALNLIGSFFFLAGIGLLYGKTGTLNIAQLAEIFRDDDQSILLNSSAMLFFVAFGIKSAVFPLFFWLPASYHTPNITITTLFAGLLTKVGIYAMVRFFSLFYMQDLFFWQNLLFIIAGLTMISGGMAASAHYEIRQILSYHIISQIGYMVMGLAFFSPLGIAGALFFTMHNMVSKTNAFMVSGLISKTQGSFYLKNVGGLFKTYPILAVLFIIPAFALAGIPPLSGFFAKFILIKEGIEAGHYVITGVAILTGMLTLYSMIKIWNEAFLKKHPGHILPLKPAVRLGWMDLLPSILLGLVSILMGLFAAPLFDACLQAATNLTDPTLYIQSVLNPALP